MMKWFRHELTLALRAWHCFGKFHVLIIILIATDIICGDGVHSELHTAANSIPQSPPRLVMQALVDTLPLPAVAGS